MTLRQDALDTLSAYPSDQWRPRFLELFADGTDPTRPEHAGAHITASALVVSHDLDRVLLCLHGRVNVWLQLGGHCEPEDATLAAAALREATEESGLTGLVINPVPIDLDTNNSVVVAQSGRAVAMLGVRDVVVVDTPEALLVCRRDRAQDLKSVVDELKRRGETDYL